MQKKAWILVGGVVCVVLAAVVTLLIILELAPPSRLGLSTPPDHVSFVLASPHGMSMPRGSRGMNWCVWSNGGKLRAAVRVTSATVWNNSLTKRKNMIVEGPIVVDHSGVRWDGAPSVVGTDPHLQDVRVWDASAGPVAWGTTTRPRGTSMFVARFCPVSGLSAIQTFRSPTGSTREKNWGMFEFRDGSLRFVHTVHPLRVVRRVSGSNNVAIVPCTAPSDEAVTAVANTATLRGNTTLVPWGDGTLVGVGHVARTGLLQQRRYEHFFYWITSDAPHRLVALTPLFQFHRPRGVPRGILKRAVQFAMGIVVEPTRVLVSFGHRDHFSCLAVFQRSAVEAFRRRLR